MSNPQYRDEHAALLARQAALEAEIAQLKADALGVPVPMRPAPPPAPKRLPYVLGAVAVGVLPLVGGFFLIRSPARNRPSRPAPHAVYGTWHGTVKEASGAATVTPGARCEIRARIDYLGGEVQAVHGTVVTCAGTEVYSEAAMFAAGNALETTSDATRHNGKYDFLLDERGVTTRPYPHAAIDTARGTGIIQGQVPPLSVVLSIEPGSKDARDVPGR